MVITIYCSYAFVKLAIFSIILATLVFSMRHRIKKNYKISSVDTSLNYDCRVESKMK